MRWGTVLPMGIFLVALMTSGGRPQDDEREDPARTIASSTDVAFLEKIAGSLAGAAELKPRGRLGGSAKELRTEAYMRLGELGTDESLAAVRRVEAQARKLVPVPARVPLTTWTHPCWHFGDHEPRPLAQVPVKDGTTYGVLADSLLGASDLFLISSKTPADKSSWTRPILIPHRMYRSIRQPTLEVKDEKTLVFAYVQVEPGPRDLMEGTLGEPPTTRPGPTRVEIHLPDILKDTDSDGWTDIEERRLGLDPARPDTDGDGLRDGEDCCPDFAPDPKAANDETTQILQRAFFATFGLSGSRWVLLASSKAPVQLWGYPGVVLYKPDHEAWRKKHGYGAVYVSWSASDRKDNTVEVEISDWEGELAASGFSVSLRKIKGEWFVVERGTAWIS